MQDHSVGTSRWRLMLDAIGEAVITTDLEGTITFWNAAAERLFGWSCDEVLGRNIVDVTPSPASHEQAERIMAALARGESWHGRFEVRRRDGRTFPALVTDAPLVDASGLLVGVIGVSTDLTQLESAEARAQRGERQAAVAGLARAALEAHDLDVLFDRAVTVLAAQCDVPLVVLGEGDPDGHRLRVRAAHGWQPDVRAGGTVPIGVALGPIGDRTTVVVEVDRAGNGTGILADHDVTGGVATLIEGRPTGFGLLAALATGPRRFEPVDVSFVEAVASVLGGAVARAASEEELRSTAEQLRASNDIRLAFLRATSHELRTPLAAVRGFAETLRDHDHDLSVDQRARYLDVLVANATRLDRLIQDLLDVDRLSSGLASATLETTRLDRVVRRIVGVLEHPDHRIDLDLQAVVTQVDVAKMERLVHSLLVNAIRHAPRDSPIAVGLHAGRDAIVLTVEDEGTGVDEAYLERIFEPFVQGPDQQRAAVPGAGLGLALVREIAQLHGGTVTVANRSGGGARFQVRLPAS